MGESRRRPVRGSNRSSVPNLARRGDRRSTVGVSRSISTGVTPRSNSGATEDSSLATDSVSDISTSPEASKTMDADEADAWLKSASWSAKVSMDGVRTSISGIAVGGCDEG